MQFLHLSVPPTSLAIEREALPAAERDKERERDEEREKEREREEEEEWRARIAVF